MGLASKALLATDAGTSQPQMLGAQRGPYLQPREGRGSACSHAGLPLLGAMGVLWLLGPTTTNGLKTCSQVHRRSRKEPAWLLLLVKLAKLIN